jgi:hypothetical protein
MVERKWSECDCDELQKIERFYFIYSLNLDIDYV